VHLAILQSFHLSASLNRTGDLCHLASDAIGHPSDIVAAAAGQFRA
jgi:hypothetical protein